MPWNPRTGFPLTWRQIVRIITASCILLIGFWRDEVTEEEVIRDLSTCLQLIQLYKTRYIKAAAQAEESIIALAKVCCESNLEF
jgi:hypothetical protein